MCRRVEARSHFSAMGWEWAVARWEAIPRWDGDRAPPPIFRVSAWYDDKGGADRLLRWLESRFMHGRPSLFLIRRQRLD